MKLFLSVKKDEDTDRIGRKRIMEEGSVVVVVRGKSKLISRSYVYSKLVVASLLTKTVKCFSVVRFDSAVSPTFECKRDGTIHVVLNTQPCNGQLEKNCKGNEKRERERPCQKKNGSRREKKNEHGESKTDKGCQNRPSQSIEEMEEKKIQLTRRKKKKKRRKLMGCYI